MRAAQRHNLAVIKPHAAEDGPEMALFLLAVWQAPVGSAHGHISIDAAGSPRDIGSLHFLDGACTTKGPEVGVGDPRELFYSNLAQWVLG